MKISELQRLENVRTDAEIPIALEGENYNISVEQIADYASSVVRFGSVMRDVSSTPGHGIVSSKPPTAGMGSVIYDQESCRFYLLVVTYGPQGGSYLCYTDWDSRDDFYSSDGTIRTDRMFALNDGRLYIAYNNALRSAGITDAQATAITHATPIEVASEEEMANRIAAGEYEEGQLYFLAES